MTPDTITVKANGIYPVKISGKFLTLLTCTAALAVELDNGGFAVAKAGSQFSDAEGFSKITFKETAGVDNTITYTVSDSPSPSVATVLQTNSPTIVSLASRLQQVGATAFPQGVNYVGVDANGRHRKAMYITNTGRTSAGAASTALVSVSTATSTWVMFVFPGTISPPIETDDKIILLAVKADLSGSDADLEAAVLELFYSGQ